MAIRSSAQVAIHTASVAAATVSASPIPFSDAALLVPIQTTMIPAIYKAYGREISEGIIKGAVTATTASAFAKSLIGNVIKMVPILGTAAGSAYGLFLWELGGWHAVVLGCLLLSALACVVYGYTFKSKRKALESINE